jgi:hypothetical protein
MAANVAGHFAAAHRVTDVDRVFHIKCFDQRREIVSECGIFVAIPWLAGAPVTASVMGDTAITL